mgnify:CR=1 FL=1
MSEARAYMPKVTVVPATLNRFTAAPIHSTRKRRVAAYARVSTNDEEQANSYEAQVSHYTRHIRSGNLFLCTLTRASPAPARKSVSNSTTWCRTRWPERST